MIQPTFTRVDDGYSIAGLAVGDMIVTDYVKCKFDRMIREGCLYPFTAEAVGYHAATERWTYRVSEWRGPRF